MPRRSCSASCGTPSTRRACSSCNPRSSATSIPRYGIGSFSRCCCGGRGPSSLCSAAPFLCSAAAVATGPAGAGAERSAVAHLERRQEGGLRDLDLAELAHALASFLLFLEKLALARDVAAVALGENVLAIGLDRLARDDPAADRRLDGDLEELARDEILQALA